MTVWTPTQDAELTQLWADKLSAVEIGQRMRKNKNQIIGRVHRLKLPARNSMIGAGSRPWIWTADKRSRLTVLRTAGWTARMIAADLNLTCRQVESRIQNMRKGTVRTAPVVKRALSAPPPAPVPRPVVVRRPIVTGVSGCQWIDGDPLIDPTKCGVDRLAGSAWCPAHHARAYVKIKGAA